MELWQYAFLFWLEVFCFGMHSFPGFTIIVFRHGYCKRLISVDARKEATPVEQPEDIEDI